MTKNKIQNYANIRYWLVWLLFLAALVYAMHQYFEYRNMELDKRIEQLK